VGLVPGKGEEMGKGYGRVNMVEILCTNVCKWKMRLIEIIPGIRVGE
jgi:hypothetical protein